MDTDTEYKVPFLIKVGRFVLDPMNRVCEIIAVEGDNVTVLLDGPHRTTIRYPRSCLREVL
jgi:hypothetical protein